MSSNKRTYETTYHASIDEEPRPSKRTKTSISFGPNFLTYMVENNPKIFNKAMSTPEASNWKEVINSDVDSIMQNHTCELVDLSPENKLLGCK